VKKYTFLKVMGPGILFASTAIGVSHLVQSTRGGADFGFAVIPFVLAANLFKFPFFEYGSRYANVTGKSLIDGYAQMGKWMLWLYILIQLVSMFFVSAAVGAVTSGFLQNLFGLNDTGEVVTVLLFIFCALILILGKFSALDKLIKVVGAALLITTLLAFVFALIEGPREQIQGFVSPELGSDSSVLFLIALMGWMPTAVDLSTWNSLWTIERIKETGYKPSLRETLLDFHFGYWISAVLAIFFVIMGSYMMYGTGEVLLDSSAGFANQVVEMYTGFIGEWSYLLITVAAFSIMFGTCIAIFDGYGRSMARSVELIKGNELKGAYVMNVILTVLGAFVIIYFFGTNMKALVDIATTISFLIAPVIAIVNFRLVTKNFPTEAKPGLVLQILSWLGILFLAGFAVYYVIILMS
jgi:Mn2+/Fe2+ NRAMP family transporter